MSQSPASSDADSKPPLPGGMSVGLSPDNMTAFLTLAAGYAGTVAETIEGLAREHILHGVDRAEVEAAVQQAGRGEAVQARKVAWGDPPIEAEDGHIDLLYEPEKPALDPNSRASVDLREVGRFVVVRKDQLLAELTPPRPGKGGKDVHGKIIPPHRPRAPALRLRAGANVRLDDQNRYFAQADGVVLNERDTLSVQPDLDVDGDVDYSTGNIRFPGKVRIKGSVTSGFVVEAAGDLAVGNNIQDARVTSLGSITVGQGIIGEGKSVVLAKGRITAGWIEHSAVEAGEDVVVGSHIFHSRVNADGWVRVVRGKGAIIGGEVWAAKGIEVRTVGSDSVRGTVVAIGGGLALNKQIAELNERIGQYEQALQKIRLGLGDTILNALLAAPQQIEKIPAGRREAVRALLEKYRRFDAEGKAAQAKRDELTATLQAGFKGEIKALATVYPGSIITIGRLSHEIKTEVDRAVFYGNFSAGDIVIQPL